MAEGPWNPGIESPIPEPLRRFSTIFRAENVYTSYGEARELRGITGLDYTELVAFRPERMALHELLIRVSADLSVPDGTRIEDLGINFRRITSEIYADYVAPQRERIAAIHAACRKALADRIDAALAPLFPNAADASAIVAAWEAKARATDDAAERAACRALARVVSALLARHGKIWGTRELTAAIATTIACNDFAACEIGRAMSPWIAKAAAERGYSVLPRQAHPVVMNTKGASASGKSTIRPLQRRLAGSIGTQWAEFALISPDIWRKQLLDYASLGAHYKYAGAFTGDELAIIDSKLDAYMAAKADRGHMSHLLIDRFRFDSFAPDSDVAGSNLLTRFGRIVYLFFMITPPDMLVERAWRRGLDIGRYKAVDDTLAHGVEAYAGMPALFFTWIESADKRVHFEFLDNSVAFGERPRTVAFGWNDSITILDVRCMLDVERFRRVDINAVSPATLFPDPAVLAPENNTGFLRECVQRFREVRFAEQASGRVYLRLVSGSAVWVDREGLKRALAEPDTRTGLAQTAAGALEDAPAVADRPAEFEEPVDTEKVHTVGAWAVPSRPPTGR